MKAKRTLANRPLRVAMEMMDMSRADLAEATGLNIFTIHRLFDGSRPSTASAALVAEALHTTEESLGLHGQDEEVAV